jgi:DNA-binding transcriptional MerR regulator
LIANNQSTDPNDYTVVAFNNCKVVSKQPMPAKLLEAYLNLRQQEQKMQALGLPIKNIEQDIKAYSDEMEKLSKLAIQDTEESTHINKPLLAQHQLVADEFNKFMQLHQQDFDALGKQGSIIGQHAQIFETSIQACLNNIDYDQIQIVTPSSQGKAHSCDKNITISVL